MMFTKIEQFKRSVMVHKYCESVSTGAFAGAFYKAFCEVIFLLLTHINSYHLPSLKAI